MDSGKFMLPFKEVQLQSSKPLGSCSSAWQSSEPGFEESGRVCRSRPPHPPPQAQSPAPGLQVVHAWKMKEKETTAMTAGTRAYWSAAD